MMRHKKNHKPPHFATRFLRWFCADDVLETLEGDLHELYHQRKKDMKKITADLLFILEVLDVCRPFAFKRKSRSTQINQIDMFRNNLKISWRNLKAQPFFTLINTLGLAIGMSGALLVGLFIYDELNYDTMFADADRIYRLNIENRTAGETSNYAAVSSPLGETVAQDYPGIELVTRFRRIKSVLLREVNTVQNIKADHVVGVDNNFFEMFGFDLLEGDPKVALLEPNSLILTRTAALKLFGHDEALGKSLILDNNDTFKITGVIEDMPRNSFLRNHTIFISIDSFEDAKSIAWNDWNFPTFVKLLPTENIEDFQPYLDTVLERYLIPWAMTFVPGLTIESARADAEKTGNYMRFNTTPLTDIHLYSLNYKGEFSENSDMKSVYILSFIGLFLLVLAVVNFMNLSTAHSLKRAKEVGIRKTLGSDRLGLIKQFLTESGLITLLSLVAALVISAIALPYFNQLAGKEISLPIGNPVFWVLIILMSIVLGLLSGTYPAFFMSKFSPLRVLKGLNNYRVGGAGIRSSLVVFQFGIAIFLIICTLVVFQQLNFIQNKDLGYQKDQVLIIDDVNAVGQQLDVFKQDVMQLGQVKQVSLSSSIPTPSSRGGTTYFIDGKETLAEDAIIVGQWGVDHNYVSTLGLELLAGRNFDEKYYTDSSAVILNESAVDMLKVTPEEAIGMRLTDDFHRQDKENMKYFTIVGVVRNFHFESLRNNIDALSLILGNRADKMIIKLEAGDYATNIGKIEKMWARVAPGQPFTYYFMDESFNNVYEAEQRLGRIFITFTILALFVACLGLFGLAAFNAEKRTKEIGIRKVLGASVGAITYRLCIDFLKLVLIAVVFSLPIGWYAMNRWLEDFSFRLEIPWYTYVIAAALAIVIALGTVSYQSIKAALLNPVDSLKSE